MRFDRKNYLLTVFSWLRWIGWPLFWLFYGGLAVVVLFFKSISGWWKRFLRSYLVFTKALSIVFFKKRKKRLQRSEKTSSVFGTLARVFGLLSIFLIGISLLFYVLIIRDLPKPQQLINGDQQVTTKIFDRNGTLLYKIYKNQNRSIVSLKDIPFDLIKATIAIEDAEFYQHPGFSIRGIMRAFSKNFQADSLQGGSTITQQLVKNSLLTSERTITRKIKELILALEVEYYFTKDEILTMYFNEVGYGGTAYGIEEAAQQYFGKSVRDIDLAEAALLAGLPQSPTVYSPFGAQPELAVSRQHEVLRRMVEEKMISPEESEVAKTKALVFAQPKTDIVAPHFVMYVKDLLVKKYGDVEVQGGGLEVVTTLDARIQQIAEEAVRSELLRLKHLHVTNGAAMVIRPSTGEILAMVGSLDYFDTAHDGQVNVTLRPRQPGSSIKPLTYAYALSERLITPTTLIDDAPVIYKIPGSPPYAPQNYDGRFHGKVTVRQALANSYNIPAVKTLSQIGVSNLVTFAEKMGISTWTNPSRFGLSLTLGGGEVKMIDMTQLFGVFANGGRLKHANPLIRVFDYSGKRRDEFLCTNEQKGCEGEMVLDPGVAFLISDILSDNQARSAAFGYRSVLVIPNQQVAVKTGTTNDLRDNWTFGYTKDFLVATWVGNNDNSPMSQVASGITGASPIWQNIMMELYAQQPSHQFLPPENVVRVAVCPITQSLVCGECPNPRYDYYLSGTQPTHACTADDVIQLSSPSPNPFDIPPRDQILEGIHIEEKRDSNRRGRNN